MARNQWQDAWEAKNADKVKEYRARYEAANHEERKRMKRAWWQAHKGIYGTRAQWLRVMKQTGGIGYSSSTNWQSRPKAGRPGQARKRGGANTAGAWTGNPNETM